MPCSLACLSETALRSSHRTYILMQGIFHFHVTLRVPCSAYSPEFHKPLCRQCLGILLFPPLSGRWTPLFKPQWLQRQQEILQEELARIYFYPALSLWNQEGPHYPSSSFFPSHLLSSVWPLLMMVPGVLLPVQPTDHQEALPPPSSWQSGMRSPLLPLV